MSFQVNLPSIIYIIYYPNDSVHSNCLPVLSTSIIHTDNLYFVSCLHNTSL